MKARGRKMLLLVMPCLALAGCRNTLECGTSSVAGKVEVRRTESVAIPRSAARLAIPATGSRLPSLPAGASYFERSGQASVEVRISHDTIYVYATCDSLRQLVEYYEQRQSAAYGQSTTKERASPLPWKPLLVLTLVLVLTIKIKR